MHGAIPLGRMLWEKAIVKMNWVISQTNGDMDRTFEMMLTDYAREMNPIHYRLHPNP